MSRATQAVQARAEILKLAQMLQRDPATLAYLETVSLEDVRALREQVTDVLWSADTTALNRIAAASRLLPAALSATISERAFGPLISAQLASRLEPARAIDVAAKLSTGFLAQVAIELDPRRASQVIAGIPLRRIAEITAELVQRGEYVTMGRFVGRLSPEALKAALSVIDNPALLRIGFVLEDKSRLERIVALLPARRMAKIVRAAAEQDLWLQALDLLSHLSARRRQRIVAGAHQLDDADSESLLDAVTEHQLWDEVLLIAEHHPALQAELAERLPPGTLHRHGEGV
jgi:hypothetical protein